MTETNACTRQDDGRPSRALVAPLGLEASSERVAPTVGPAALSRRSLLTGAAAGSALLGLTGCVSDTNQAEPLATPEPADPSLPPLPMDAQIQTFLQPPHIRPEQVASVGSIYARSGYLPLWFDGRQWTPRGQAVFYYLVNAYKEGLLVTDYLPIGFTQLPQKIADRPGRDRATIAQTDVILTDGLLRYLRDLSEGRDPQLPRSDGLHLFDLAMRAPDIGGYINTLVPRNPQYLGLRAELDTLRRLDNRRTLVAINMERWRRLQPASHELDVMVNLPTFHLECRRLGHPELHMPVVIGKEARKTPILTEDRIVNLKFSPDWGVPPTIEAEDIIPILQARPELFAKMNLQALRGNQFVDVMSVDWSKVDPVNNSYHFRQPPGPDAALGGVRFSLTNPYDIYLHDSPDRSKFRRRNRALSSGCVRVGEAASLAHWLLKDEGWSPEQVQAHMTSGRTTIQALRRPMPVTMNYFTAWVGPGGKVRYGMDVYGLDKELSERIDFGAPPEHPFVPAQAAETAEGVAEELSP